MPTQSDYSCIPEHLQALAALRDVANISEEQYLDERAELLSQSDLPPHVLGSRPHAIGKSQRDPKVESATRIASYLACWKGRIDELVEVRLRLKRQLNRAVRQIHTPRVIYRYAEFLTRFRESISPAWYFGTFVLPVWVLVAIGFVVSSHFQCSWFTSGLLILSFGLLGLIASSHLLHIPTKRSLANARQRYFRRMASLTDEGHSNRNQLVRIDAALLKARGLHRKLLSSSSITGESVPTKEPEPKGNAPMHRHMKLSWLIAGIVAAIGLSTVMSAIVVLALMVLWSAKDDAIEKEVVQPSQVNQKEVTKPATPESQTAESSEKQQGSSGNVPTQENSFEELAGIVSPAIARIETNTSQGSGFCIASEGVLVTNFHVVEGAKTASALFPNNARLEIVGFLAVSPGKDLAILKFNQPAAKIQALSLVDVLPDQGQSVLAFGSPRGLTGTMSDGIVSAVRTGYEVATMFKNENHGFDIYSDLMSYNLDATWIQTTTPISPGNSGGPLVNVDGQVVGVNTWHHPEGQNLNFAISSSDIRALLKNNTGHIHSLSQLPERPESEWAAETRRERDRAQEEAEKRQRQLAKEEKNRLDAIKDLQQRQALQQELDRLNARMITVKNEIRVVENDGARLTAMRGQLMAQGKAVYVNLSQTGPQLLRLQNRVASLSGAINSRRVGGVIYRPGFREDIFSQLRLERQQVLSDLQALQHHSSELKAAYSGLDFQARDLLGQIQYKTAERAKLTMVLQELVRQYKEALIASGDE